MKKVGDLMKELGFNKNASDSVKEAFIKNMIKSAYGIEVQTPSEARESKPQHNRHAPPPPTEHKQPIQLSFDFFSDDSGKKKVG